MRSGLPGFRFRIAACAVMASAVGAPLLAAADWAQWRGPSMMAVIDGRANLPETWSATQGVAWKTRVPGLGWSSPIVWGNRIFVTAVTVDIDGEPPQKGLS